MKFEGSGVWNTKPSHMDINRNTEWILGISILMVDFDHFLNVFPGYANRVSIISPQMEIKQHP